MNPWAFPPLKGCNKPKNGKVFDTKIVLPVVKNLDHNHEYTVDDIDWDYMCDYIAELKRNYITELDAYLLTKLDAYLQAAGLSSYELTDEDKKAITFYLQKEHLTKRELWKILAKMK